MAHALVVGLAAGDGCDTCTFHDHSSRILAPTHRQRHRFTRPRLPWDWLDLRPPQMPMRVISWPRLIRALTYSAIVNAWNQPMMYRNAGQPAALRCATAVQVGGPSRLSRRRSARGLGARSCQPSPPHAGCGRVAAWAFGEAGIRISQRARSAGKT